MTRMKKNLWTAFFTAGLMIAGLAFSSCKRAESAGGASAFKAVEAKPVAPSWQLTDLNGKPVSSADFKGKVVVVDFWATWCPPCIAEIPGYIELQKKLEPQGFTLVGLSLDEIEPAEVKKFVEAKGINYPVAIADQELLASFASVEGIPATFVLDREGKIRFQKVGSAPIEQLENVVKDLL